MQCHADCTILTPAKFNQGAPTFLCAGCHPYCWGQSSCSGPLINQCTGCDGFMFRTLFGGQCVCMSGYIDVGQYKCQKCDVPIPGCNTCSSVSQCTLCEPGFVLTAMGTCQCTIGSLVSGVCTTVVGCTRIIGFAATFLCT